MGRAFYHPIEPSKVTKTTGMAPARTERDGFDVSIEEVPVTVQRRPFIPRRGDEMLKDPGTPRANIAASVEEPNGTQKGDWARRNKHQTVLQLNFSYPPLPPGHYLPDPFFRIYIARIHKDKHGSDSGTYDTEGRFVPQKFEDIFAKYAGGDKKGITMGEVWTYMKGQRLYGDPIGWGAAGFEWIATWILLWPEDGRMKKDDIRRIYDGSLFFEIAARRKKQGGQRMINGS